ncbi:MAG: S41 family peptidase [Defluviitaleaceae bacterium]|nr:S41 family peptidase [Defluviitaleaceae bacterium]
MKKLTLTLVLAFIFVACNTAVEPNLEVDIEPTVEISTPQNPERTALQEMLDIANDNWNISSGDFLSSEDVLYDIDFLVQTLEENFPFMSLVERVTGINEPLNSFRDNLTFHAQSENLDSSSFGNLIEGYFYDIFFSSMAHLRVNPLDYHGLWSFDLNPQIDAPPTIIEEGKIALIPVNPSFFNNFATLREMVDLQNFIAEIQGYEHVILDLTHIGGGFIDTAIETFILPNLSEPLYITEFAFITDGVFPTNEHSERLRRVNGNQLIGGSDFLALRNLVSPLVPAAEFAAQHNLTNMNQDDLQNLAYGFIIETLLQPTDLSSLERINWSSRLPLLADNIWLLVSPTNGSAGAIFANIAKEAGLTLVGEQTSHWNSDGRAFFELPRTGHIISMDTFYITDSTGRNIEEFPPEPHYFNRPGMDALQTTLAIIAERAEME